VNELYTELRAQWIADNPPSADPFAPHEPVVSISLLAIESEILSLRAAA
jgi:hypothetical protein